MLKTVTETVNKLKEANQLTSTPDIVHSTLELYGTLTRKMSPFLIQMMSMHDHNGHLLVHMADIANIALHFNEHPVVKSAVGFITELSRQSDQRFQSTLKQFGQYYVTSLIQVTTEGRNLTVKVFRVSGRNFIRNHLFPKRLGKYIFE